MCVYHTHKFQFSSNSLVHPWLFVVIPELETHIGCSNKRGARTTQWTSESTCLTLNAFFFFEIYPMLMCPFQIQQIDCIPLSKRNMPNKSQRKNKPTAPLVQSRLTFCKVRYWNQTFAIILECIWLLVSSDPSQKQFEGAGRPAKMCITRRTGTAMRLLLAILHPERTWPITARYSVDCS